MTAVTRTIVAPGPVADALGGRMLASIAGFGFLSKLGRDTLGFLAYALGTVEVTAAGEQLEPMAECPRCDMRFVPVRSIPTKRERDATSPSGEVTLPAGDAFIPFEQLPQQPQTRVLRFDMPEFAILNSALNGHVSSMHGNTDKSYARAAEKLRDRVAAAWNGAS